MVKIGDFARLGQVSVRMLRHYDSIGLLVPARVDEWNGHRSYSAAQLPRLNRIVALRDLGFPLAAIARLLDDCPAEAVEGLLRDRRDALAAEVSDSGRRLAEVERRLHLMRKERTMTEHEFTISPLPAARLAELSAPVREVADIGQVIGGLYARLAPAVQAAGANLGPSIAWYEFDEDGSGTVHAAWEYAGKPAGGFRIADLPACPTAACTTWSGPLGRITEPWQAMSAWWEQQGWRISGPCREVYLQHPAGLEPDGTWVVQLQQPVERA